MLVDLLAKVLRVPKSSLETVSGAEGRSKQVRVAGVGVENVRERLSIAGRQSTGGPI